MEDICHYLFTWTIECTIYGNQNSKATNLYDILETTSFRDKSRSVVGSSWGDYYRDEITTKEPDKGILGWLLVLCDTVMAITWLCICQIHSPVNYKEWTSVYTNKDKIKQDFIRHLYGMQTVTKQSNSVLNVWCQLQWREQEISELTKVHLE